VGTSQNTKVKRRGKRKEEEEADKCRLNLLIDGELKRFAHRYAKKHHTSVTALVTQHFVELREREKGINVRQI
jgi:hypothetical protein